ncbi:MAG: cell division protein FtsQ/DivIB [Dokdonella sp.]
MRGGALIKLLAWTIALTLVALPIVGVLSGRFAADRWPLRTLKLTAELEHVSAEQIQGAVATQTDKGFFALDLKQVRAAVMELPWVARVDVSKRWPDTLEVTVFEQLPFARWGENRLVSTSGELFEVPGSAPLHSLPQFFAADDRAADVLDFHARCEKQLAGTGLALRAMNLSGRGGWQLTLANGVVIDIGTDNTDARLRRFIDIWPRIAAGRNVPVSVDLRYENGFSVRWNDIQIPDASPTGNGSGTTVNKA